MTRAPHNYVFKRTAEDMLRSSGPLSVSGRLTRRWASGWLEDYWGCLIKLEGLRTRWFRMDASIL